MKLQMAAAMAAVGITLSGCAVTSDVMDTGGGTYMISAHASVIRGGATGASQLAYEDAEKFCARKGADLHVVVLNDKERDVYQSSVGGSWNRSGGSFGGSTAAAGNADFHFKCGA